MTSRRALLAAVAVLGVLAGLAAGRWLFAAPAAVPSATLPSTADIGFSQDMAVHHEQAIELAAIAAGRATAPVQALATTIQLSQARESGAMRGWLQLWDAPQLPRTAPMAWMPHHGGAHRSGDAAPMPGMASRPEIDQLTSLGGHDFDVRFLQLMIRHHQGGVLMARDAQPLLRVPAVRDFALSVVGTQTDEIVAMTAGLARAGAAVPAPP